MEKGMNGLYSENAISTESFQNSTEYIYTCIGTALRKMNNNFYDFLLENRQFKIRCRYS